MKCIDQKEIRNGMIVLLGNELCGVDESLFSVVCGGSSDNNDDAKL